MKERAAPTACPALETLPTEFASAGRATREELEAQRRLLELQDLLTPMLDASDVLVMVLNRHRQIVYANTKVLEALGIPEPEEILGLRPGEALACRHAERAPGGCGTSRACASCGAVLSFLAAQRSRTPCERECRITTGGADGIQCFEFLARSVPLRVGSEALTLFSLRDISAEKRREALQRIFFHDVLNTVGGLHGWTQVLSRLVPEGRSREVAETVRHLGEQLRDEIESQRDLLDAERGHLVPRPEPTTLNTLLDALSTRFEGHPMARDRRLQVVSSSPDVHLTIDRVLALRVMTNMVKNAMEATPPGGTVKVWTVDDEDACTIHVWNAGCIPPSVALHIFERSFSTKGSSGRGLGTYSMKLLGERYLGGRVVFTSTQSEGTTFSLTLPLQPPPSTRSVDEGVAPERGEGEPRYRCPRDSRYGPGRGLSMRSVSPCEPAGEPITPGANGPRRRRAPGR